jgi:transposase-like protein
VTANLLAPHFICPIKAREYLEKTRWPHGTVCPHCGVIGDHWACKAATLRPGVYKCKDCRKPFTVTVGTVFERSKVPLNKWLLAVHLMCASKKAMSAHQIHRMLGVSYNTSWFMCHRIREAMAPGGTQALLGLTGGHVEVDETYWGKRKSVVKKRGYHHKMKVVSMVERDGVKRSVVVERVTAKSLGPLLAANISKNAILNTDEFASYAGIGKEFAAHNVVNHSKGEYVRRDASTNMVESSFSLLKRGLIGTFHHVGEQHLQRYVIEFDFRWNHRKTTDAERSDTLLTKVAGKRLTYRQRKGDAKALKEA